MNIYDEFFAVIKGINAAHIKCALVGGIALSFYVEPRYTKDIDFLVLSSCLDDLKSILKSMGYTFEAEPWACKNTNMTLHRLSKIEGEDSLTIDLLEAREERHCQIIENAITEATAHGLVCIATRQDLIWLKRLRNSAQDRADIEALASDKD